MSGGRVYLRRRYRSSRFERARAFSPLSYRKPPPLQCSHAIAPLANWDEPCLAPKWKAVAPPGFRIDRFRGVSRRQSRVPWGARPGRAAGGFARSGTEFEAELDLGVIALEIRKIQCARDAGGPACRLGTPARDHPHAVGQSRVEGRSDEQGLSGETVERKPLVFTQEASLAA